VVPGLRGEGPLSSRLCDRAGMVIDPACAQRGKLGFVHVGINEKPCKAEREDDGQLLFKLKLQGLHSVLFISFNVGYEDGFIAVR
jgi:hypothetical protein